MKLANEGDSLGRRGEILASIAWPGGIAWANIAKTSIDGEITYVIRARTPSLVEMDVEFHYADREQAERDFSVVLWGIAKLSIDEPRKKLTRQGFAVYLESKSRPEMERERALAKVFKIPEPRFGLTVERRLS